MTTSLDVFRAIRRAAENLRLIDYTARLREDGDEDPLRPEVAAEVFWDTLRDEADALRAVARAMPAIALPWESLGETHVRYAPGRLLELAYVGRMNDGRFLVAVAGRLEKTAPSLKGGMRYADRRLRGLGALLAEEAPC
jgi:hypothetical protein